MREDENIDTLKIWITHLQEIIEEDKRVFKKIKELCGGIDLSTKIHITNLINASFKRFDIKEGDEI